MHLLTKTNLTFTRSFLTSIALALHILSPYKTNCAAAARTDHAFLTHLALQKPTGGKFNLSLAFPLANFSCTLETFIKERVLPKSSDTITIQLYGNPHFDTEDFRGARMYIGSMTSTKEPCLPIATYTLSISNGKIVPDLKKLPIFFPPNSPNRSYSRPECAVSPYATPHSGVYAPHYPNLTPYPEQRYSYQQPFYPPYPPTLQAAAFPTQEYAKQPPLPAPIADLLPEHIASYGAFGEQITLIKYCGTVDQKSALEKWELKQKLAVTQKALEAAQRALTAQSQSQPPKVTPAEEPQHSLAKAQPPIAQQPSPVSTQPLPATAVPRPSVAVVLHPLGAVSQPLLVTAFPPLSKETQAKPTPKPQPSNAQLLPPAKSTLTHSASPLLQTAAQPPHNSLPDCNDRDRRRYLEINSELRRPTNSNYTLCIEHLQQCDPHTSGYLPHVTMCVNALNKLNRYPELSELLVFDQLVVEAQKSAPERYQFPLTTYLTKRKQQESKRKAEEERARQEKEVQRNREEDERKREEERQEKERTQREANKKRMEEARKKQEEKIAREQEALITQSGKLREELPEETVIKARSGKAPTSLSHADKRRALKAAAAQAEDDHYRSILSLLEQREFLQALTKLSGCEKNSRRFTNLFLTHLATLEKGVTEAEQALLKTLAVDLLATPVVAKPLDREEKIVLLHYLARHSAGDERLGYLTQGIKLKDLLSEASFLETELDPSKADFIVTEVSPHEENCRKVSKFLSTHTSSLSKEVKAALKKKFRLSTGVHVIDKNPDNPLPPGYTIACEIHKGNEILVAYDKEGDVWLDQTLIFALKNTPQIEEDTFDVFFTACLTYIDKITHANKSPLKHRNEAIDIVMQRFIIQLNGRENLLINAMEGLFENYELGAYLACQAILTFISRESRFALAQKIDSLYPSFLQRLHEIGFFKNFPELITSMNSLHEVAKEIITSSAPAPTDSTTLPAEVAQNAG